MNLCIVARYNEDINWIKELNCDIKIYNKGENFNFPFDRVDIPNRGREAETYVKSIVDIYDDLEKYETVFFVQGHPFDTHPDLIEHLNNFTYSKDVISLSPNYERMLTIDKNEFAHGKSISIIDRLAKGTLFEGVDVFKEGALKSGTLAYILNIHQVPVTWWTGNAQYAVPVTKLTNKSHKWWKDTLKVFHFYEEYTNESIGHLMEHLWPRLFEYSDLLDLTEGPLKFKI